MTRRMRIGFALVHRSRSEPATGRCGESAGHNVLNYNFFFLLLVEFEATRLICRLFKDDVLVVDIITAVWRKVFEVLFENCWSLFCFLGRKGFCNLRQCSGFLSES
jgi:hypothetical protein